MRLLAMTIFAAAPLLAQQQAPHDSPRPEEDRAERLMRDPAAIAAGRDAYLAVCSGCHGVNAEGGRGPNLISAKNLRRASDEELFAMLKNGIPGTDMPPSPLPDEQVWSAAAYVRSLSAPAYQQPSPGDPEAGRALFFGAAGCSGCHMIRGQGGSLGPDLTNAGAANNFSQLREALLEPNKRFSDGFRPVTATLVDGSRLEGVAKNNSNYSLQLLDASGRLHLLDKRRVAEARFREKSWMPDDYTTRLDERQIDDLLAFLGRQAVRPPAPRKRGSRR